METVTRLFAGLILVTAFGSGAVAADRPVMTTGINARLDSVIQAQMSRELQKHDPAGELPAESNRKVPVFELDAPDTIPGRCPCYEYVYRLTSQKPAL